MTALNADAKAALRDAGVTQAEWARANWGGDGRWYGDACGCFDDRCIGHHHDPGEECGCLASLLESYLDGNAWMFAIPPHSRRQARRS